MSRYIDAEKLWEEIESEDIYTDFQSACIFKMVREKINNAPTADVVEVRHGKWIKVNTIYNVTDVYECSLCNRHLYVDKDTSKDIIQKIAPYCHCGTRMEVEKV